MNKMKAWIIAGRFFAAPWIAVNTLLGVKLAGFDLNAWVLSFSIIFSLLLSSHYINAWRDYVKGIDSVKDGSSAKPYTSASQVIPRGWLSVTEAKISAVVFLLIAVMLFILYAPKKPDTIVLFALAVFVAVTYTDLFKPKGLGEIALFLGHGVSTTTLSYSMLTSVDITGISAGVLMGLFAGLGYTIDQWQDVETDFTKRIRNYAQIISQTSISISTFYYFAITAVVTIHLAMVFIGFLPQYTVKAVLLLPLFHFTGVMLEYRFEKGILLALLGMWLYPLLMI